MADQMIAHILAMNVVAPLAALAWLAARSDRRPARALAPATALQIVLLWGWHLPAAMGIAAASAWASGAMLLSLLAAAAWFWWSVFGAPAEARWRALGALLVTGKLFCLLGVLLTFAPRAIYGAHVPHTAPGNAVADQQLAGLIMLAACPLTYTLTAVFLAYRWLVAIDRLPQLARLA
jgi:putative membrane protein